MLYHVTYARRLSSIAESGLRPGAGEGGKFGGGYTGHSEGRLFWTDAEGVRFWVSRLKEAGRGRSDHPVQGGYVPVVLRTDAVDPEGAEIDDEGTRDAPPGSTSYHTDEPVASGDLEVYDPEVGWGRLYPERGDEIVDWLTGIADVKRYGPGDVVYEYDVETMVPQALEAKRWHGRLGRRLEEGLVDAVFGTDDRTAPDPRAAAKRIKGRLREMLDDAAGRRRDRLSDAAEAIDQFRWKHPAPSAARHLRRALEALDGIGGDAQAICDEIALIGRALDERRALGEGILDTVSDALGLGDEPGDSTSERIDHLADKGREGGTTSPAAERSEIPLVAYAVGRNLEDESDVSQKRVQRAFSSAVRMLQQHGLLEPESHDMTDRGERVLRGLRQEPDYVEAHDRYGWALERIRGESVRRPPTDVLATHLLAEDDSARGKTMVALYPPEPIKDRLAPHLGPGIERDELHLTVLYLGECTEAEARRAGRRLSVEGPTLPIPEITCDGGPVFTNDDADVRVMLFNGPRLDRLRVRVLEALRGEGLVGELDHGFTPHVTLGYHDPGSGPGDLFDGGGPAYGDLPPWRPESIDVVREDNIVQSIALGGGASGGSDLRRRSRQLLGRARSLRRGRRRTNNAT